MRIFKNCLKFLKVRFSFYASGVGMTFWPDVCQYQCQCWSMSSSLAQCL